MLINTVLGEMDETLLDKIEGSLDNSNEYTTWVEYRMKGAPVESAPIHRSCHVTMKEPVISSSFLGE